MFLLEPVAKYWQWSANRFPCYLLSSLLSSEWYLTTLGEERHVQWRKTLKRWFLFHGSDQTDQARASKHTQNCTDWVPFDCSARKQLIDKFISAIWHKARLYIFIEGWQLGAESGYTKFCQHLQQSLSFVSVVKVDPWNIRSFLKKECHQSSVS